MDKPTIHILGAYRVEPTEGLFRRAMESKYGGLRLPRKQRLEAERSVREELDSVALLEVLVEHRDDRFQVGDFAQPGNDQAAYDEAFLSPDGSSVLSRWRVPEGGTVRVVFFLHFFDPEKPLLTSYGELPVPPLQEMPERLHSLVPYEPVG